MLSGKSVSLEVEADASVGSCPDWPRVEGGC